MAGAFFLQPKNEALRDQLESRVALRKGQGVIEACSDRRIAGDVIDEAIFSKRLLFKKN